MKPEPLKTQEISTLPNFGGKVILAELTLPELESWFEAALGEPRFRARQVWQWIWRKLARDFAQMTDVSKKTRAILAEKAVIGWPETADVKISADGSVKFLIRLFDGALIESVLIPSKDQSGATRWTQCLSSQVGCAMGCAFCATGRLGFERNMTMGEIMTQILIGKEYLKDTRPDWPVLRNLVFMGMGEPLLNMRALLPALRGMSHDEGLNFSPRRITVSTCGIESGLAELGESGLAYLAVSLHAPNQELRQRIMPRAARWPLEKMMEALREYPLKTRERLTFEYLLLGGVNDGMEHARQLARLMAPIRAKLNLIVYNPSPGLPWRAPEAAAIENFQNFLCAKNITAIIRKSKGGDIAAACGQLAAQKRNCA